MNFTNVTNKTMKQYDALQVKEHIRAKFGFISRFSKIVGIPVYKVNKALHGGCEEDLEYIGDLASNTDDKVIQGEEIGEQKILQIRMRIKNEYGSAINFCACNPGFSSHYISKISRSNRLRLTDKLKNICDILNIPV